MKHTKQSMKGILWSLTIGMALLLTGCGSGSASSADDTSSNETPTATLATPLQDATGIPLDPVINITFDTLMDPTSINEETIYLVADATGDIVTGTVTLLEDNATVVFTTVANLLPGEAYTLVVSTGVQDLLGNHLLSTLTSQFTVGDMARVVVPIAMPVVGAVLDTQAAQFLISTLSSLLGSTEGLPLTLDDLNALSVEQLPLNDLLAGVQALNPSATTVGDLLATDMPLETLLGLLTANLPEGSSALAPLQAIIDQLALGQGDLLGQTLSLGDILTLPTALLSLAPTDLAVTDPLSVVTSPLALLEVIGQALNGGAIVNDAVLGPIIANVTQGGGLVLESGVLSQLPTVSELAILVPADMLELVNTILASADPVGIIETILGGTNIVSLLTTLLGGDLSNTIDALLAGLTTDPTTTLTGLLGLLSTISA